MTPERHAACYLKSVFVLELLAVAAGSVLLLGLLWRRKFQAGSRIIYRVVEASDHPGPEARDVRPSEQGELYYYQTMKYWRVEEVLEDGWLVALTPHMQRQYLRWNDPNLRKASPLERIRFAARFPQMPLTTVARAA